MQLSLAIAGAIMGTNASAGKDSTGLERSGSFSRNRSSNLEKLALAPPAPLLTLIPVPLHGLGLGTVGAPEAPASGDGAAEPPPPPPGPDALLVTMDLPADPVSGLPTPSPAHPPLIDIGQLLIEPQPRAVIHLASRLVAIKDTIQKRAAAAAAEAAVEASNLFDGVDDEDQAEVADADAEGEGSLGPRPPSVVAPSAPSKLSDATEAMASRQSPTEAGQREAAKKALKATSMHVHALSIRIVDDTLPEPAPRACLSLDLEHAGFSFPPNQVGMLLGPLQIRIDVLDTAAAGATPSGAPPPRAPPIISTHSSCRGTFYPGDAWSLDATLPTLIVREPQILPQPWCALRPRAPHETSPWRTAERVTRPAAPLGFASSPSPPRLGCSPLSPSPQVCATCSDQRRQGHGQGRAGWPPLVRGAQGEPGRDATHHEGGRRRGDPRP